MKTNKSAWIWHTVLIIWVVLILFPLIYAASNSFKTLSDAYNNVFSLIPKEFTLDNYRHIFARQDFVNIALNTLKVASGVTIFKLLTSILAAYAFVFLEMKGKKSTIF